MTQQESDKRKTGEGAMKGWATRRRRQRDRRDVLDRLIEVADSITGELVVGGRPDGQPQARLVSDNTLINWRDRITSAIRILNGSAGGTRGDVSESSPEAPALFELAAEFVRYWTTDRTPDGCGMCGGIPHSTTCYVGRMASLLGSHGTQGSMEPASSAQSEAHESSSQLGTHCG